MTDDNSTNYYTLKTNLKTYNSILKKSIRIAQIKYYEAIFSKFKGDIRGTWKSINDIVTFSLDHINNACSLDMIFSCHEHWNFL